MAIVLAMGALAMAPGDQRPDVVIVTDVGDEVDDQWAIAHIALSPEFNLVGVVTTHAPNLSDPSAEASGRFAVDLVGKFPPARRPKIVIGASKALADFAKPASNPGLDFLLEASKGHDAAHRLVVVVIGAATDVGAALIADPSWADRVQVVAMGFNDHPKGGDPWNVKNDPIAWRVLLDSKAPIVVGDTATARKHLRMTPDRVHTLLATLPEPALALLDRFDAWIARNAKVAQADTGSPIVWPIWDEITTAYLLGLARAESRPRPRLRDDLSFDLDSPRGTIEWITTIDESKLWADLVAKIRNGT